MCLKFCHTLRLVFVLSFLSLQQHTAMAVAIKFVLPSLWVRAQNSIILKTAGNSASQSLNSAPRSPSADTLNFVARAAMTGAVRKSLLIQNIDGNILLYNSSINRFVVTDILVNSSTDLTVQMFVLTLNVEAVKFRHRSDRKSVEIVREFIRNIAERGSSSTRNSGDHSYRNSNNFILIRAVYWPYYLCYNAQQSVYGSKIENDSLSQDCIWYRAAQPSGYMLLTRLASLPLSGNFSRPNSNQLVLSSALLRNYSSREPHAEWAISFSDHRLESSRRRRSLLHLELKLGGASWLFELYREWHRTLLPVICYQLDRLIEQQLQLRMDVLHRVHRLRRRLHFAHTIPNANFDDFIRHHIALYLYRTRLRRFRFLLHLYQTHNHQIFVNQMQQSIARLHHNFSSTVLTAPRVRFQMCSAVFESSLASSCNCLLSPVSDLDTDETKTKCNFHTLMQSQEPHWIELPTEAELIQARGISRLYSHSFSRSRNTEDPIIARRRAYLSRKRKTRFYSDFNYRAQICV